MHIKSEILVAFRSGAFQKALDAYNSCLEWNGDNMTVKRDVVEGMARCWSKLGQQDKALDLANLLVTTVLHT